MKRTVRLGQVFTRLLWLEVFVAALLVMLTLLWHLWRPVGLWQALEWSFAPLLLGVVAAVPPLLMIPLLEVRQTQRLACVRTFRRTVTTRLVPLVGTMSVGEMLAVSWLAGVSEEVFFRGVLQHEIGLLPAALVFGILHALSLPYLLWATAVGCYLGWLAQVSGNLWLPITTHALVDIVGLGYIRFVAAPRATDVSLPLDA
jgi:membrane protease YdiL (CAAX protease family)